MKKLRDYPFILSCACLLTLAAFILSLFLGKYPLTPADLLAGDSRTWRVFLTLRLPRTCMALLGGLGLGIAGNVFQTVFHNPLASPDIIGVSSGASAGAAFAILFFSSAPLTLTFSAFGGGLLAVLLALLLSSLASGKKNSSLVLSGIAVHSLAQTFLMALKLTADPEKQLASIEYWIMGSLNAITLQKLPWTTIICLFSIFLLFLLYRQILLLSVEEEEARMLGVDIGKMRILVLLLATLCVASVISVTGLISFVGLLAPHTARLLTKDNRLPTLFLSGILGSLLLLCADMLARYTASTELPVSIFTSLLGAPFLLYLLLRRDFAT